VVGADFRPVVGGGGPPAAWGDIDLSHRGSPGELLARGAPVWRPRGVRVLVSDLLWVGEPLMTLKRFTDGAAAAAVIQVLGETDADPPLGDLRLVDTETDQVREIHVDAGVAGRYREALARHQQNWDQACRQTGAVFCAVVAEKVVRDWKLEELVAAELLRVV
jgi:hypothetical protein